jgi:hypothetical protein
MTASLSPMAGRRRLRLSNDGGTLEPDFNIDAFMQGVDREVPVKGHASCRCQRKSSMTMPLAPKRHRFFGETSLAWPKPRLELLEIEQFQCCSDPSR